MTSQTLDMKDIRYLNLFGKISGVRCKNCFIYNNCIIFAVPSPLVSKAIGKNGKNVKRMIPIVRKKIKIIALPKNIENAEEFILEVVAPVNFKNLEITREEIIITGSRQSKAALIGRNKVRLLEMQKIIKQVFDKALRIV